VDATAGLYTALLLSGLLGSLGHCLGMCGPLVVMLGLRLPVQGPAAWPLYLLYHGARVAVYALLGLVAGALGSLLGLGAALNRLAGAASLALGLGVVLLGLGYLGWLPLGWLMGAGGRLDRLMGRALQQGGLRGVALTGALNGLLPCGLVYSALLASATAGGAGPGALGMLMFGAGTMPALLVVGVGAGALSRRSRQAWSRLAGGFIIVVGAQLALRGAAALRWMPHLQVGSVMLW
jgi:uncharacterized protein